MRIGPLGIWELLIILLVVLLIFGPRRLPEMAKGIGQSVREFRKGLRDMKDEFESETSATKADAASTQADAASTRAEVASARAEVASDKEERKDAVSPIDPLPESKSA